MNKTILNKAKKYIMDNCIGYRSIVDEIDAALKTYPDKVIYFVRTPKLTWGKGFSLTEAAKNAKANWPSLKNCQVTLVVFNNLISEKEFKNQYVCFTVDKMGSVVYYDEPKEHDWKNRDKYFIGYIDMI